MAFEKLWWTWREQKNATEKQNTQIFMNWSDDNWIANSPQETWKQREKKAIRPHRLNGMRRNDERVEKWTKQRIKLVCA